MPENSFANSTEEEGRTLSVLRGPDILGPAILYLRLQGVFTARLSRLLTAPCILLFRIAAADTSYLRRQRTGSWAGCPARQMPCKCAGQRITRSLCRGTRFHCPGLKGRAPAQLCVYPDLPGG